MRGKQGVNPAIHQREILTIINSYVFISWVKRALPTCRELGVSEQTSHRYRNQFGGLKADDAKRLKDLERENSTLKWLLAKAELEKAALKKIASGNF